MQLFILNTVNQSCAHSMDHEYQFWDCTFQEECLTTSHEFTLPPKIEGGASAKVNSPDQVKTSIFGHAAYIAIATVIIIAYCTKQ